LAFEVYAPPFESDVNDSTLRRQDDEDVGGHGRDRIQVQLRHAAPPSLSIIRIVCTISNQNHTTL
jgi:hypothetical protein